MLSIYNGANVIITAKDSIGNQLDFKNSQIAIDSTGKANDVLKRILVDVAYSGSQTNTPFALQTTSSLCKHFYITDQNGLPTKTGLPGGVDTSSCYGAP